MTIEAETLELGDAFCTEEVHFTGGLRGLQVEQGWALIPIPAEKETVELVFSTSKEHGQFVSQCGGHFIGVCIKYHSPDSHVPMHVWEPGQRESTSGLHAADSWSAVAYRAREAGDIAYADCALHISVSLKLAGLRLRDVSNGYHDQLRWALLANKKVGTWFSNAALLDLHADFHSLLSELCSARDHLARLAGMHAGADKKIDSLAKLEGWAEKPSNSSAAREPLVTNLLVELGTRANPGWLRRLGAIRNEVIHRIPMAANKSTSGLTLQEVETRYGPVRTIRLAEPSFEVPLENQGLDPLTELSQLSMKFEHLSRAAWRLARYPAEIPEIGETPAP